MGSYINQPTDSSVTPNRAMPMMNREQFAGAANFAPMPAMGVGAPNRPAGGVPMPQMAGAGQQQMNILSLLQQGNTNANTGVAVQRMMAQKNAQGGQDTPATAAPAAPPVPGYGLRHDGITKKGNGYLGAMQRPDGSVSSEISVGVNMNGKETDIPLMVPGLTKGELDYLLNNDVHGPRFIKDMPPAIMQKARTHAAQRLSQNLSVFAD
jgi:hypothetical protein